jgi:hypothetical protein
MQVKQNFRVESKSTVVRALCVIGCICAVVPSAQATTLFSAKADAVSNMSQALGNHTWSEIEGQVALSTNYTHSGKQSYQLSYPANESQAYLAIPVAAGRKHVFLRWWEVREKAGDFSGAHDYDWSAEKTIRFRSSTIESTGVDYCLGWEAASGQVGTAGTDGPGPFVIFGNSVASDEDDLLRATPQIQRGKWNMYEVEIDLGTRGQSNGAVRIWVNDKLLGQTSGLSLLPKTDASIEEIWVGGWYSGLSPNPAPARRYIDDVVLADAKIGFGNSGPTQPVKPNPPTNVAVH